jgi:hypothetical protein
VSAPRVLPTWQPLRTCSDTGCLQDAAYERPDGRCYRHGKIADGLMQQIESRVGRPATGRYESSKGRGHHKRRKSA